VALGLSVSALFSASVTGTNPVTSSGTFTLNLALAPQNANTFLAGPTSGGSGPVTARKIVAADLPGLVAASFSSTPVFDASTGSVFTMTLTGNVTSSSVINATVGQEITFILRQDGVGGRTFAWMTNAKGASNIGADANVYSAQTFVFDGTSLHATSPGNVHA